MSRKFTTAEKLACVRRELRERRRLYPFKIGQGKISKPFADEQIALMEAIEQDYEQKAQSERLL